MTRAIRFMGMLVLVGGWASSTAHGALVASYQFTGDSPAAQDVAAGLTLSDFTTGLSGGLQFSGTIGSPAAPSVFVPYSLVPKNGSYSDDAWLGFTVGPQFGFDLALESLQFNAQKDKDNPATANDVVSIQVRTSLDEFVNFNTLDTFTLNNNSGHFVVNLQQVLAGLVVNPQTLGIRLYLMNSDNTSFAATGFHLDNVRLNGAVALREDISDVPLPSTAVLMLMGLVFPAAKLRRRNQASTAV